MYRKRRLLNPPYSLKQFCEPYFAFHFLRNNEYYSNSLVRVRVIVRITINIHANLELIALSIIANDS